MKKGKMTKGFVLSLLGTFTLAISLGILQSWAIRSDPEINDILLSLSKEEQISLFMALLCFVGLTVLIAFVAIKLIGTSEKEEKQ